jgi:dihydroorotase-like cyclic amidohydrolase
VDVSLAVSKAKYDADTDIVKVALKYACAEDKAVAVVAEDTDIMVLLSVAPHSN